MGGQAGAGIEPLLVAFGLLAAILIVTLFRAFPALLYFLVLTGVVGGLMTLGERWFPMPPEQFIPICVLVLCGVILLLKLWLWIREGQGKR